MKFIPNQPLRKVEPNLIQLYPLLENPLLEKVEQNPITLYPLLEKVEQNSTFEKDSNS